MMIKNVIYLVLWKDYFELLADELILR